MSMMFRNFLNNIFEKTKNFDRREIEDLFKQEILIHDKLHDIFLAKYNSYWQKWVQDQKGEQEQIGHFFDRYGAELIKEYLTTNFPFAEKRIYLNVRKGGTNFDIVFTFIYKFVKKELEVISRIALKNLETLSASLITTRVFAEALLSFNNIISESVGYKYAMMVEEVKFLQKRGQEGTIVYMEFSARPHA